MDNKLSIVHLVPALTKGGAERVVVDLANATACNDHAVSVVAFWKVDEKVLRNQLSPNIRVIYMSERKLSFPLRIALSVVWLVQNSAWLRKQDVIHCHLTSAEILGTLLYILPQWLFGPRPAIVETCHAVGMPIPRQLRAFHAVMCKRRDGLALIADDPFWSKFITRNRKLLVRKIQNGIETPIGPAETERVLAYCQKVNIPDTARRIIGSVGQFRPERRPKFFAEVFLDILQRADPDVHILMCGDGSELEDVRQLVAKAGFADRFTLPGMLNEPRLALSTMQLYLTLNVGETTGIAALEAAFCGVPIVAWQADPQYLSKPNDWIWSSSNKVEIVDKVLSLLSDQKSKDILKKKQHSYALSKFSAATMAKSYEALYFEAIFRHGQITPRTR